RRESAARDLTPSHDRVAGPSDPRSLDHERHQPFGRRRPTRGRDRLGADEARLLLAAPAQPGLDGPPILGEVVAVEVKAGLEPQRVAGPETYRHSAAVYQGIPHILGVLRRQQQFHTVP